MNTLKERPFEHFRRLADGQPFSPDIVKGWYAARAYVLQKLRDVAFSPDSDSHLHVVVDGDSPHMLFVVRQLALSAHYINYRENEDERTRHRTVITIVSTRPDIKAELEKEEYLCNLPKHCKWTGTDGQTLNAGSYVDIELRIEAQPPTDANAHTVVVAMPEVEANFSRATADAELLSIDTRKAYYASRVYSLGTVIDNLPAEDIHCARRYTLALDLFQHEQLGRKPQPLIGTDCQTDQIRLREQLSNIFCADCFESRSLSMQRCAGDRAETGTSLWEQYNEALSVSEHARWVTEKLIMGYAPLTSQQRYHDENLFHDRTRREQYRRSLKKDMRHPAHIDLCSYADLRRINPNDLKFDSFLMLAIPRILKKH